MIDPKNFELDFVLNKVNNLRSMGKKIVFTNGVFDILHIGHLHLLLEAKKQGDVLVVGVNSDSSVRLLNKGPFRPINSELWRATLLYYLKPVDFVVIFEERTPEHVVETLKPDVHVKGGDYSREDLPEAKIVERYGGRVVIIPFQYNCSTTKIVERIITNSNKESNKR